MSAASRSMTTATSVRSAGMCVCLSGVGGGDGERGEEIDLVEAWEPARRQGSDRDRFKTRCCAPGGAPAGVGTCSPPRPCRPPLPTHCAGHARVYVAFDTLFRLLQDLGFDVKYVRNFTGQRVGAPRPWCEVGLRVRGGPGPPILSTPAPNPNAGMQTSTTRSSGDLRRLAGPGKI